MVRAWIEYHTSLVSRGNVEYTDTCILWSSVNKETCLLEGGSFNQAFHQLTIVD